jgi:hypothetical protein
VYVFDYLTKIVKKSELPNFLPGFLFIFFAILFGNVKSFTYICSVERATGR